MSGFDLRMWVPCLLSLALMGCEGTYAAANCMSDPTGSDQAIASCTRAIEAASGDPRKLIPLYEQRAAHLQSKARTDEALADMDRAMRLAPDNADLILRRGIINGMAHRLDAAAADFRRVIELNPGSFAAHMNLGKVLADRSLFREALPEYERAVAISPDDPTAYEGICWVRAVIADDLDAALSDCDRSLSLRPGVANALNNRGFVNYRMKRHAQSIADYTAAIAIDPSVASSYYVRGLARLAQGDDPQSARKDIARGLAMEPGIAARYAGYGIDTGNADTDTAR